MAYDKDSDRSIDDKLADAKKAFRLAADAEADNRAEALDDLRFARLAEQWPQEIREQRRREQRPCLTNNRLPSFIRQVTNDARQNKPQIKVKPVDDKSDPRTAEVLNGLIRTIEKSSQADAAYDTACDFAVTMGWGYLRVGLRYEHDDSFDQELTIDRVANPFAVYADPYSVEADSSDWNMAFVTEMVPRDEFRRRYKGAEEADWDSDSYTRLESPWTESDAILVAEYWRREEVARTIVKLSDGMVMDESAWKKARGVFETVGLSVVATRKVQGHKIRHCLMTGAEIIEENDWAGRYIPIIPVYGDEVNVEGKRHFRSLIRDAKDAQRMFNFWRTASTELVALAPKAPFIGPKGAFDIDRDKWDTANTATHPFLEYKPVVDGVHARPERQPFAGVPAGALQEALNASDDMKAIMGLFDASLGKQGNEISGRAIIARQREGDTSTFHFIDNLSRAIKHTGLVLVDLIPKVYTPPRIIRIIGEDDGEAMVRLGQQESQQAGQPADGQAGGVLGVFDLNVGRYDVAVDSGPSYTTRREETAAQMLDLVRAFPQAAPVIGDLLAKNLDWPQADEIARRLQTMLPPQMQEQQQQDPRLAQVVQQLQQAMGELDQMKRDHAVEDAKNAIDQYEAETKRMKVLADMMKPTASPTR